MGQVPRSRRHLLQRSSGRSRSDQLLREGESGCQGGSAGQGRVFTVDRNVDVKDAEAKKARQELAKIQEEWDQIGYVPRDDMRRIENRLDAVDKQIKAIEDAAWKQTDPEADARKSSFEEQLNAQLAELDAKIAAESDPKKKAKLEAEKATKEQWLNAIK